MLSASALNVLVSTLAWLVTSANGGIGPFFGRGRIFHLKNFKSICGISARCAGFHYYQVLSIVLVRLKNNKIRADYATNFVISMV